MRLNCLTSSLAHGSAGDEKRDGSLFRLPFNSVMENRPVKAMEDSGDRFSYYLATALSLSIGWGIRGNFGHEYGAMIPGALAAMAAVLLSRRGDWVREVPFFGMFGALGWSFGGSISYMQVIAYTHSGHSPSVLYGFACLFVSWRDGSARWIPKNPRRGPAAASPSSWPSGSSSW